MRIGRISLLSSVLLAVALSGCAARNSAGRATDRNVLNTSEIRTSGFTDAYTLVKSLRPLWLNQRGTTSFSGSEPVKVYLDGSLMGGPDALAQITCASISSLRFMNGLEASSRWGLDHGSGAILVSTRP